MFICSPVVASRQVEKLRPPDMEYLCTDYWSGMQGVYLQNKHDGINDHRTLTITKFVFPLQWVGSKHDLAQSDQNKTYIKMTIM